MHKDKHCMRGNVAQGQCVARSQRVARLLRPRVTPMLPAARRVLPPHPWVPARVQLKAAPCPHARLSPLAPSPPAPHGFPGPPRAGLGGLWPPSGGHKGTGGGPGAPADPQLPGPTAILGMYTLMSNKQYYDAICSGTISNTEGINSE